MKKFIILAFLTIAILGVTFLLWSKSINEANRKIDEIVGNTQPAEPASDSKEFFKLNTLDKDLVDFANQVGKNYEGGNSPDYDDGVPPFEFYKRIDCQVIYADKRTEEIIKQYTDTVFFHTIVLLRDSRGHLYDFSLTSTLPDKSILRLGSYGPLTNENPAVVNLPINERRLKDFPIDFQNNKVLSDADGECVHIPYPVIGGWAFWLFGNDIKNSPIQGMYRNDRFKDTQEFIELMKRSMEENN